VPFTTSGQKTYPVYSTAPGKYTMTENRQLEMAYEKTRRKTIESEENKK